MLASSTLAVAQRAQRVEGAVTAVALDEGGALASFSLQAPGMGRRPGPTSNITVTPDTTYPFASWPGTEADVVVGARVSARLTARLRRGEGTASAVSIRLPWHREISGTISSTAADSAGNLRSFGLDIAATRRSAARTVNVSVGSQTAYRIGDGPATSRAVVVGAKAEVLVQAFGRGRSLNAVAVLITPTDPIVSGVVYEVGVYEEDGVTVTAFLLLPDGAEPDMANMLTLWVYPNPYFGDEQPFPATVVTGGPTGTAADIVPGASVTVVLQAPIDPDSGMGDAESVDITAYGDPPVTGG